MWPPSDGLDKLTVGPRTLNDSVVAVPPDRFVPSGLVCSHEPATKLTSTAPGAQWKLGFVIRYRKRCTLFDCSRAVNSELLAALTTVSVETPFTTSVSIGNGVPLNVRGTSLPFTLCSVAGSWSPAWRMVA